MTHELAESVLQAEIARAKRTIGEDFDISYLVGWLRSLTKSLLIAYVPEEAILNSHDPDNLIVDTFPSP